MAPVVTSTTIRGQVHPHNCLKWHDDRIVLTTQTGVSLIPITQTSPTVKPMEVVPDMNTMGTPRFLCTTEDALSLTDAPTSTARLVDSALSPYGPGPHRSRLLVILTSDHRCAVFAPSKNPNKDRWNLCHALFNTALARLGYTSSDVIQAIDSIKHLRTTSIAWTPPYFHADSKWGDSFLVTGTEGGEVHFHRIDHKTQNLVFVLNCSSHRIVKLACGAWSQDGQLFMTAVDSNGTVYALTCYITIDNAQASISTSSSCQEVLRCSSLVNDVACTSFAVNDFLIAIATTGEVIVARLETELGQISKIAYRLPFYSVVSGLVWMETTPKSAILYVFSYSGSVLVLSYTSTPEQLDLQEDSTRQAAAFATEELKSRQADAAQANALSLQYRGVAQSPGGLLLAISYAVEPVERIQYKISSTYVSYVGTMTTKKNFTYALETLLTTFVDNPFSTSLSAIRDLHERLKVPLLDTLDAVASKEPSADLTIPAKVPRGPSNYAYQQDRLLESLYRTRHLNHHRVALASKALPAKIASQVASDMQSHLIRELLSCGSSYGDRLGQPGRKILHRYANYLLSQDQDDDTLVDAANEALEVANESSREILEDNCPACSVVMDSAGPIHSARCANGHYWDRCSITLTILGDANSRTCLDCGRKAVSLEDHTDADDFYSHVIEVCDMCYYCSGKWHVKL